MKIAIFDLDMTLSDGYSGSEITSEFEKEKLINPGFIKGYTKLRKDYVEGKLKYNDMMMPWQKLIETTFYNVKLIDLIRYTRDVYKPIKKIYPWVRELFDTLHKKEYIISVVSASFDFYVEVLQDELDFDTYYATSYEVREGRFTGKNNFVVNDKVKASYVKQLLPSNYTIAVGDAKGDEDMLEIVDKGFYLLHSDNANLHEKPEFPNVTTVTRDNIVSKILEVA